MPTTEEINAACRRLAKVARRVPSSERKMSAALVALQRLHALDHAEAVDHAARARVARQLRQLALAQRLSTKAIYSRRKAQ